MFETDRVLSSYVVKDVYMDMGLSEGDTPTTQNT